VNASDVGLDERFRAAPLSDGHERSAVNDPVAPVKGVANRRDVTDIALCGVERTSLPFKNPARFVRISYEGPDPMAGAEQGAHGVRSGKAGRTGYENSGGLGRHRPRLCRA
jgi:hypothetical protein